MRQTADVLPLSNGSRPASNIDEKFEEFWRYYPKRVGKATAKALFKKIVTGGMETRTLEKDSGRYLTLELEADPDEIIEGAKIYAREQVGTDYKLKDGGKYTCHPSTWLNQGRWMDLS